MNHKLKIKPNRKIKLNSIGFSLEEKEDIGLARAIKQGAKGKYVSKESVLKALSK